MPFSLFCSLHLGNKYEFYFNDSQTGPLEHAVAPKILLQHSLRFLILFTLFGIAITCTLHIQIMTFFFQFLKFFWDQMKQRRLQTKQKWSLPISMVTIWPCWMFIMPINRVSHLWQIYFCQTAVKCTVGSLLMDTSVKQTPKVGASLSLLPLFDSL